MLLQCSLRSICLPEALASLGWPKSVWKNQTCVLSEAWTANFTCKCFCKKLVSHWECTVLCTVPTVQFVISMCIGAYVQKFCTLISEGVILLLVNILFEWWSRCIGFRPCIIAPHVAAIWVGLLLSHVKGIPTPVNVYKMNIPVFVWKG